MAQHAVRMVQRVMTPGGDKNGADISALDASRWRSRTPTNAFVVVGGAATSRWSRSSSDDRKAFVGGRAFTAGDAEPTEFIAYENQSRSAPRNPRARPVNQRGTQSIEGGSTRHAL